MVYLLCCRSVGSSSSSSSTNSTKSSRLPYGVILLTLVYVIVVLMVSLVAPECLDEPCNSEGLDNSISGWSTDFFIAIAMIWMGLHLWCCSDQPVYFSSIWSLWYMGVAYILGGVGHSVYTNSGLDDNAGQQGFYITWAVSFTFMTMSIGSTYRFIQQVSAGRNTISRCMSNFLTVSLVLVILAWLATSGGYIWCATEEDLHVVGATDTIPPLDEDSTGTIEECLQLAFAAELSWYACFSLFWIPAGMILRATVLETELMEQGGERLTVYGFRAAWAAWWIPIIPWTFGIMLIVYSGIAAIATGREGTEIYEQIYGAVVYHYGMLIGYFFLHNLAYALPWDETKAKVANDSSVSSKRQSYKEDSL
jgi:hypothetical protein